MKIYQVGGSVRDELLGQAPKDFDYVVVGATSAQMLDLGYTLQGKDFPVFLHPETKAEYALARTERKTGNGYAGFSCDTEGVTLKEDLYRRDLTINAMAKDEQGGIIDYYGGLQDLSSKTLRHVGPHFSEDPLRVLRVARFQARYPDFTIAPETMKLMQQLVASGELSHLSKERFQKEIEKAFTEKYPDLFFKVLCTTGFFQHYIPEFTYSEEYFAKINQEASVISKMLYLVLGQESIGLAMTALKNKLGFNDAYLQEVLSAYTQSLTVGDTDSLYSFCKKTRPLSKTTSFSMLKELMSLTGQSSQVLTDCESMARCMAQTDFSFLENLPAASRANEMKKYTLAHWQKP